MTVQPATTTSPSTRRRRPEVHRRRWLTVLTTMATATAAWTVARPIGGVDLAVRTGGSTRQVEGLAVTLTALVAGLASWLLLVLLEHRTPRALGIWTVIAAAVFVGSLLGPLGAVTAGGRAVLVGLHALVAVMLVVGMRRSARRVPPAQVTGDGRGSRSHAGGR